MRDIRKKEIAEEELVAKNDSMSEVWQWFGYLYNLSGNGQHYNLYSASLKGNMLRVFHSGR